MWLCWDFIWIMGPLRGVFFFFLSHHTCLVYYCSVDNQGGGVLIWFFSCKCLLSSLSEWGEWQQRPHWKVVDSASPGEGFIRSANLSWGGDLDGALPLCLLLWFLLFGVPLSRFPWIFPAVNQAKWPAARQCQHVRVCPHLRTRCHRRGGGHFWGYY